MFQEAVEPIELDPREYQFGEKNKKEKVVEQGIETKLVILVCVGKDLEPKVKEYLISLLRKYSDVFAYSAANMPGISKDTICHHLSVEKGAKPMRQKKSQWKRTKPSKQKSTSYLKQTPLSPTNTPNG